MGDVAMRGRTTWFCSWRAQAAGACRADFGVQVACGFEGAVKVTEMAKVKAMLAE